MRNYTRTPSIFQMEMTECGAASLCMILAYYGRYVPLEEMRVEAGVSRDGCNMRGIKRAAEKYGMEVHAYRKEPGALCKMPMPCIIHWNFNHFVVLEGFKGKHAFLNDPALGRRKIPMSELNECFTGIVMTLKKTERFQKARKKGTTLSFVHQRLRGEYAVIFKLIYVGLLLVFPGLVLPVLSQVFIDDILGNGYDWLTKLLVFMGCCILMKEGLSYYRAVLLQKLKTRMTLMSSQRFMLHTLHLPISFFDQRYTGDIANRMANNQELNDFLAGDLAQTVLNMITACFYLVVLILYSPFMTAMGMIKVGVCLAAVAMSSRSLKDSTVKLQMAGGKLSGAISAGLSITDSIKASGVEAAYSNRILGHQAKHAGLLQELTRRQEMLAMVPDAAGKIVDVLLLLLGGMMVIHGQMTMGMLFAFNSLYDSFCEPVDALVSFFLSTQQMRSNIARVEDIECYPQDEQYDTAKAKEQVDVKGKLQGHIELREIAFGYNPTVAPIIQDFSIALQCGESVAFVGASGCGKSTISKVISGLYHPWAGELLFDGIPQQKIPGNVLNTSIATVSQDICLFSGTVRENLIMWDRSILEEDMVQAAKDACIHDFIVQQPGGYDFLLDENARNLSGGQRQRLEIARALALNPSILVMDEATSALDPIVEKKIMDAIRRRGCTCVIVAHRLSAIRDCNQIVVMKDGKIVERGNHKSLMKADGYYASLMLEEGKKPVTVEKKSEVEEP